MSVAVGWVLAGLVFWLTIAVLVGVLLGQVIRRRDEEDEHR